jgi:hypothetical protein
MGLHSAARFAALCCTLALTAAWPPPVGQAQATLPPTSYRPDDDVALGQEAAAEFRARVSVVTDPEVNAYIQALGSRLTNALPRGLSASAFQYSFEVVDTPEGAGFPGGPISITRSVIESVQTERQLAATIARLLGHVALRHGTAQVTAGEPFQLGAIPGRVIGMAAAGHGRGVIEQAFTFAAASYFLTYGAEYEGEADRLAAQTTAGAGFDAVDPRAARAFASMQARLRALPRDADSGPGRYTLTGSGEGSLADIGVVGPSGEYRPVPLGDRMRARIPGNWHRLPGANGLLFAPEGGFGRSDTGTYRATHGLLVAVARSVTGDLQQDIGALLVHMGRHSPQLRWRPAYQNVRVGPWPGVTTTAMHVSANGAFEQVLVSGVHLPEAQLLYAVGVAPEYEASSYRRAFADTLASIEIVEPH